MCYCPTPKLSPHRRLCIFRFSKKHHLVCFFFVKPFGLRGHTQCPHKPPSCCNTHVIIQICVLINNTYIPVHSHTLTHSRTHSLAHTLTLSLSLTHTHSLTHTLTHSLSLTHTLTHTLSLSHSHTHSHSLTHSLTHTHTLSRTHTHTHTHTHTVVMCCGITCLILSSSLVKVHLMKRAGVQWRSVSHCSQSLAVYCKS